MGKVHFLVFLIKLLKTIVVAFTVDTIVGVGIETGIQIYNND